MGLEEVIMDTWLGTKILLSCSLLWFLYWTPETLHRDLPSELRKGLHIQTWWRKPEVASDFSLFSQCVKDAVFFLEGCQQSWRPLQFRHAATTFPGWCWFWQVFRHSLPSRSLSWSSYRVNYQTTVDLSKCPCDAYSASYHRDGNLQWFPWHF